MRFTVKFDSPLKINEYTRLFTLKWKDKGFIIESRKTPELKESLPDEMNSFPSLRWIQKIYHVLCSRKK